jgi:hypothetical protein
MPRQAQYGILAAPSTGKPLPSPYYNHSVKLRPSPAQGRFASANVTLFEPVVALAPAGPERGERAVEALNRAIPFLRGILFRPQFDPALQRVIALMPPRETTLIQAAALYGDLTIPWRRSSATHELDVSGHQRGLGFLFSLSPAYCRPDAAFTFGGTFSLTPSGRFTPDASTPNPTSVRGHLAGDLTLENFGATALIDLLAAGLAETYRNLAYGGDAADGEFNRHDHAVVVRLRRDAPEFAARLAHYFAVDNIVDEFLSPNRQFTLVNLNARLRTEALAPYPDLSRFYLHFASGVVIDSQVRDSHDNYWFHAQFDRGRIRVIFAILNGMLVPFNKDLRPAGDPVSLEKVTSGHWRTITSITLDKFGTTLGIGNIAYRNDYRRQGETMVVNSRMDSVPQLIAPPGINWIMRLLAGEFLQTLAHGDSGMSASVGSARDAQGIFHVSAALDAKLLYSPALMTLGRIGDAIADAHNVKVRNDERRLARELFEAAVDDYNNARPQIISMDKFADSPKAPAATQWADEER